MSTGRPFVLLAVVAWALASVVAATTSLAIALPSVVEDLDASQVELVWMSNAGTVVFAGALLPAGLVADRLGRRRVLVAGLLVFVVGQVVTAAAPVPAVVMAGQAVAGLGAAVVTPTTLAVLLVDAPASGRDRAVAVWAGVTSLAATVGGLGAGLLLLTGSWRVVPLAFGVMAALAVVPLSRVVQDSRDPSARPDVPGGVLVLLGLVGIVLGAGQLGSGGPATSAVLALSLGVAALVAFAVWELRTPHPMLDLRLLRSRSVASGSILSLLLLGSFSAFTLLTVQYLQLVRELSPLGSAAALLPSDVGVLAVTIVLPAVLRLLGARWTGALGAGLTGVALLLLAAAATAGSLLPTLAALVLLGVGFALTLTPATTLVFDGMPRERAGVSSALTNVNRQVGQALGTAVVGSLLVAVYRSRLSTAVEGLEPGQAELARSGLEQADQVAQQLGPGGEALREAAVEAFLGGYQGSLLACAAMAFAGAVAVAVLAPSGVTAGRQEEDVLADAGPGPRPDARPGRDGR